jgi:hypothetical protein
MAEDDVPQVVTDIEAAAANEAAIAWQLERLVAAGEKLADGPLTTDAVVALIQLHTGRAISKESIKQVLKALPRLREFLRKK